MVLYCDATNICIWGFIWLIQFELKLVDCCEIKNVECLIISCFLLRSLQYLQTHAEKMYMTFKAAAHEQNCKPSFMQRGLCGEPTNSFEIVSCKKDNISGKTGFSDLDLATIKKVKSWLELILIFDFRVFWYLCTYKQFMFGFFSPSL